MTIRFKHSKRQIKRLFTKNPARLRIQKKLDRLCPDSGAAAATEPPTPPHHRRPLYEPIFTPVFLPNGWSAPPPKEQTIPDYPFQVSRTRNKPNNAVGFLPVYTKHRNDGTKVTTRIKKIKGDADLFLQELRAILQLDDDDSHKIRVRTGGMVEIDGNRARQVREWLAGLGF